MSPEPTMPTAEDLNENPEESVVEDKISEYRRQITAVKSLLEDEMWNEDSKNTMKNDLEKLMNGLKMEIGEEKARQITALDSLIKDEIWNEDSRNKMIEALTEIEESL